jgi:hypothetical protein
VNPHGDKITKKILLVLGAAVFTFTAHGATIVFSDLGPGDTYDQASGYGVTGGGADIAAKFIAGASGDLANIDLGLTFSAGVSGPVNVFLYGDASGTPDNLNQTLLGSGTPTVAFGTTDNSLVSFAVAGTVPVTIGTTYWLVLKPAAATGFDVWNLSSPPTPGSVDTSADHATWTGVGPAAILPAFRLTATSATGVPDSGATFLLLLAALIPLFFSQRNLIRRQVSQ